MMEKESKIGLPKNLRAKLEDGSTSMDDVRVHYNSSKPSALEALKYAQEADIRTAPGQEKHLDHEISHVVQQRQGRLRPQTEIKIPAQIQEEENGHPAVKKSLRKWMP